MTTAVPEPPTEAVPEQPSGEVTRFISTRTVPYDRGAELGETFRERVQATVSGYRDLFARAAGTTSAPDVDALGTQALERIDGWAPALGAEIRGIAAGAGLPVAAVAAINARTEILAMARRAGGPTGIGECSAVVALGDGGAEPVAAQNWDWYPELADGWFVWEVPHPDGRRTVTLTEYGIVGKIGVNDRGVGCLFTILHHRDDGQTIGVPVHVIARRVLDESATVVDALLIAGSATVSASTTLTLVGSRAAGRTAVSVELWPGGPHHVLPEPSGLLLRTNHFLTPIGAAGDTEPVTGPDTLVRYDVLRRGLHGPGGGATVADVRSILTDHTGGWGALCCHPDPKNSAADEQFATLAHVQLRLADGDLDVTPGNPCQH